MSLKAIKALCRAKKFEKALSSLEKFLARQRECPHLWNLRGDLIQLLETKEGPPLNEAAKSYKKSLRLDPNNLEALESLAHFYDAVDPRPTMAKRYAEAYVAKARRGLADMERIIAGEGVTLYSLRRRLKNDSVA